MPDNRYRGLTPEQKYDLLTKDFLERDGDHFVRIRKSDRLGWEDTLPKGSPYSAAILSPKDDRQLLNNACRLARQMISAMNCPFKVDVHIDATRSCTDSRNVFVATRVFDEKEMDLGQKLDVFLGLAIHEGSHLLYTDFSMLGKEKREIVRNIQNIIEDEMIERRLGDEKPGMANFLKATKYYYFGRYRKATESIEQTPATRLYNAILKMVRYPAALTPDELTEFADPLLEIRDILTPYPEDTATGMEKALEVYEVLKRYLSEEEQEQQGQQDGQGQQSQGAGDDSSGAGCDGKSQLSDEEIEALLKSLIKAADELSNTLDKPEADDMSKAARQNDALLAKECDGQLEIGTQGNTVIIKAEPNKEAYESSLARVRRYIPATAKALKSNSTDYRHEMTGMSSGRLDTRKLAEARQGVQTVYIRKREVKADKVNAVLLVDESGSMSGKREQMTRDAAILINEACKTIDNVNLFIYGYTSESRNILFSYREDNDRCDRYALGSISNYGGTPTGTAIRETVGRVSRRNHEKTLLFVLSDGAAAGGTGSVRKAVNEARQKGFTTIGISIASSLGEEQLRGMYDHYLEMWDIQDLAKGLAAVVKKAIIQTTKKHI